MNALLKSFFNATISLKEFLEAFASAIEARKEAEDYAAYKENNYKCILMSETEKQYKVVSNSLPVQQQDCITFVQYNEENECFKCTCNQMNFVGIPCRHIIPTSLFLNRWCKDPNKNTLVQHYTSFYNSRCASAARGENSQAEVDSQNNQELSTIRFESDIKKN
ncbi:405_t:CDS:2 [Paraglomus occultum]|uniref:405_t:CDS:1 n=1 Tax=Paraglomus occultum TaxID=144539 RepID=A0A9N9CEW9_9GLOM|nr:405_t:CDS:2 [Paraglomus occultum]